MTYDEYIQTMSSISDISKWERGESLEDKTEDKPMSPQEWIEWAKKNPVQAAVTGTKAISKEEKEKMRKDLFEDNNGKPLVGLKFEGNVK